MAVWIFVGCLSAQPLLKFMGRQVTIVEPEHTEDGFPKGPASVCLEGPPRRQCYTAPKDYGNNPTITPVQLGKDQSALLFSAETGGVSGWLVHFALLGPGLQESLVEDVSVSSQNQHTFWTESTISDALIFITGRLRLRSE
jgi:hypothetical protein